MNDVGILRIVAAVVLWGIAVILFVYNARLSFYLWRESVGSSMLLALDSKLPLRFGFSIGLAVILIVFGLIALAPDAIGLLDEGVVVACVIGILTAINISIRQQAARKLASKNDDHPASEDND